MPRLSRWAIRLSLLYLLAGFTIGALMLMQKAVLCCPSIWRWFVAHHEFLLFGWMLQFSLGVAYWALPRFRGNDRGRVELAAASLIFLNLGIGLVFVSSFWGWPLYAWGRWCELFSGLIFIIYSWARVKPPGA